MLNNFAEEQVERVSRNIAIICLAVVGFTVPMLWFFAPDLKSMYVKSVKFDAYEDLYNRYKGRCLYVTTTADVLFDTGFYTARDGNIKSKYYAFNCSNKEDISYILCLAENKLTEPIYENYEVRGFLYTPRNRFAKEIIAKFGTEATVDSKIADYEPPAVFVPLMIDMLDDKTFQILTTLGLVSTLLSIAGIIYALLNKFDYTRNVYYKRLGQDYFVSAEKINELISEEMMRGCIVFNHEYLTLTSNFILCTNFLSFQAKKKDSLIWAYHVKTPLQLDAPNFIIDYTIFRIVLKFADGDTMKFEIKSRFECQQIMEALQQYNPYAFYGFTRELASTFKQERQSLITMVNERMRLI